MQTKLDEAKAELLDRAARVAENSPAGGKLPTGTTEGDTPDPVVDSLSEAVAQAERLAVSG